MSNSKLCILLSLLFAVNFAACKKAPPAKPADLVVQSIASSTVDCPTGGGSCVTTVTFTITNTGAGNAGSFNVKITLDPSQSIIVNQAVAGLAAGASQTFTIMSPPGGNCFDSDCKVCITVDSGNSVVESSETNNELCKNFIG